MPRESVETISVPSSTKKRRLVFNIAEVAGRALVIAYSAGVMARAEKVGEALEPWPRPTVLSTGCVVRSAQRNAVVRPVR